MLLLLTAIVAGCGGSGDEYDGSREIDTSLSTPDQFMRYFNQQQGDLDDTAYAGAYNAAVDPGNARSNLQDYITLHGLDNPDVHVIFRDTKDLGYGRDMYMRSYPNTDCGGQTIAFYVRNFSVQIVEDFAYGPINLEAAIEGDTKHLIGTNAIEFGQGRTTGGALDVCSPEPMTRFFTFEPEAGQARRVRVDLDGRGEKAMPQPCISCHGGKLRPLDRNGDFVAVHAEDLAAQIGDVKARLQAFEVDSFEFSEDAPYRRVDIEEGLRKLNTAIYCTYPGSAGHAACADHGGGVGIQMNDGEWSGDIARDVLLGWYGNALETAGAKFDDSYVPDGWKPSAGGPPAGADVLFTKVVGPNCFVCHGKQGGQLGTDEDTTIGKDVDFESWDKFISYADDIERLVFDEGRMPLGLPNYQDFWLRDPQKAELLASFIAPYVTDSSGFAARRTDSNGDIILPGRVVARAGLDRVTSPGAPITLDARATFFAESYLWELVSSPAGSTVNIASPNAIRSDFSADTDGDYVISLTATSDSTDATKTDMLSIKLDSTLPVAPRSLTFYNNITDEFSALRPVTGSARACDSCHKDAGGVDGVPMWWTAIQSSVAQPVGTPLLNLYEQAMARVMPEFIEDSLLLKKPSGQHHYGRQADGFDTSLPVGEVDRASYDLFVNWIAEGAKCGMAGPECP